MFLAINWEEEIFEISKYILPSLFVLIASIFILRQTANILLQREAIKERNKKYKTLLPLRLQAYERLALYLERISPENLVRRFARESSNAGTICNMIITSINEEFDHNMAQQIYVSREVWKAVKEARNFVVKLVHEAMAEVGPEALTPHLLDKIWKNYQTAEKNLHTLAVELIHEEVKSILK